MNIFELHMWSILNMSILHIYCKSFLHMKNMKALSLILFNIFLGTLCFNEFLESYPIKKYLTESILMLLLKKKKEPSCCNLFSFGSHIALRFHWKNLEFSSRLLLFFTWWLIYLLMHLNNLKKKSLNGWNQEWDCRVQN